MTTIIFNTVKSIIVLLGIWLMFVLVVYAACGGFAVKHANAASQNALHLRIFKLSSTLEVWEEKGPIKGHLFLVRTMKICKYSGKLGPKKRLGDRQAPEGFYKITSRSMNPNSRYHLSMNLGYPNEYDRAHNRTGAYLMIHGKCVSIGCYAMTDNGIDYLYSKVQNSLRHNNHVTVSIYPFRMTDDNMKRFKNNSNVSFWWNLKEGHDYFEVFNKIPVISVCDASKTRKKHPKYAINSDFVLNYRIKCPDSVW